MNENGVLVFPDKGVSSSIDPNLLLALQNNGGFGNGGYWMWILFLWLISGNNGFGNGFGGNGAGFLSNQMNNDTGRELLMNAILGNRDSINSLANLLNTEVSTVLNGIFTLNNAINSVGNLVGMSGLQILNAIQSGDAAISSLIYQCCCENRLAICQLTNALLSLLAANHSALQMQLANGQSADLMAVLNLTNQLGSLADRNTRAITDAIAALTTLMTKEFCDIKEREMQSKIDTLSDIITQLRGQLDNDRLTALLYSVISPLLAKVNEIANKQPNTVPVQWPNIQAVNVTPYAYGFGFNNGWGSNSFWN